MRPDLGSSNRTVAARILAEQRTRIERQQQVLDQLECLGLREAAQHASTTLKSMTEQLRNLSADLKEAEERVALELDDVPVPSEFRTGLRARRGAADPFRRSVT